MVMFILANFYTESLDFLKHVICSPVQFKRFRMEFFGIERPLG